MTKKNIILLLALPLLAGIGSSKMIPTAQRLEMPALEVLPSRTHEFMAENRAIATCADYQAAISGSGGGGTGGGSGGETCRWVDKAVYDANHVGYGYYSTEAACANLCSSYPSLCTYFAWGGPTAGIYTYLCFMSQTNAFTSNINGFISGKRGCNS